LKHVNAGHWDLPKGHIELGETLEEIALREIEEETGIPKLKLQVIKQLSHENHYYTYKKGILRSKTVILFLVQTFSNQIKLSHEHIDFQWISFDELASKLTFPVSLGAFRESEDYFTGTNLKM
jgi:8-oxo-dGTP pyrophosphatase MutT (NUDIX family)